MENLKAKWSNGAHFFQGILFCGQKNALLSTALKAPQIIEGSLAVGV